ncbi:hypothetical protein LN650_23170 [Klebsiella pneumoniae subsp. pneumoniae]|nr:hypothetical protein [Klebsiella pneumoniae subsp. pneumoniae]
MPASVINSSPVSVRDRINYGSNIHLFHWFGGASIILRAAENIDGLYFGIPAQARSGKNIIFN